MLDARAVAVQGLGFTPRLVAVQGFGEAVEVRRSRASVLKKLQDAKAWAKGGRSLYRVGRIDAAGAQFVPLIIVEPAVSAIVGGRRHKGSTPAMVKGFARIMAQSSAHGTLAFPSSAVGYATSQLLGSISVQSTGETVFSASSGVSPTGVVVIASANDARAIGQKHLTNQQLAAAVVSVRIDTTRR